MYKWHDLKVSPERDRIFLQSRYFSVYHTAANELEVETPNDNTLRVLQELRNYTNGRCVRSQSARTTVIKSRTCGHSSSWDQNPDQLKQVEDYTSVGRDKHVSYFCRVTQPLKQLKVNTTSIICSCESWLRLKIAGRHLIATLNAKKKIFELSVLKDQCYQVTT